MSPNTKATKPVTRTNNKPVDPVVDNEVGRHREYVDTKGASEFTTLAVDTLITWRSRGKGPKFYRPGGSRKVIYSLADLRKFIEE